jgi:hypothetical protein
MRPVALLRKGLSALVPLRAQLSYEANGLSALLAIGGRELERRIVFSGEAKPLGVALVVVPDTVEGMNTKGLSLELQSQLGTFSYGLIIRYPQLESLPSNSTALLQDAFDVSEFDPSQNASTLETGTGICSDTDCQVLTPTELTEELLQDSLVAESGLEVED